MITSFTGQYAFLSNFYPCLIIWQGLEYPTAEHLYQSRKLALPIDAELVRVQLTPGRAGRLARKLPMWPNWENNKVEVMREVLLLKFQQHLDLAYLLHRAVYEHTTLIEGNKWGDKFWGCTMNSEGQWDGKNQLGFLLQRVCYQLRTQHPEWLEAHNGKDLV